MWIILISLVIGIIIGLLKGLPGKWMKYNTRFQQAGIVVLIFTMGASIGANKKIISNLQAMGIKAFVFAVLTSLLSIIAVYLVSSRLMREGSEE